MIVLIYSLITWINCFTAPVPYNDLVSHFDSVVIGTTFEGRDIVKVDIDGPENSRKILVECGNQASDWNSIGFCSDLVDAIQTNEVLNKVSWTIVPVLNPDGYEYSVSNDRNWIKNRAGSGFCRGVNINHNMPTPKWGDGASNECSDDYQGFASLSEAESQALNSLDISSYDAYFSIQDVGDRVIIPYGSSTSANTHEDFGDLENAATDLAALLSTSKGTPYTASQGYDYENSRGNGQTRDWSYRYTGYAFTLYLDDDRFASSGTIQNQADKMRISIESFLTDYIINKPVVWTVGGGWRGTTPTPNVEVFNGIPFASPPTGPLRFRSPKPAERREKISSAKVQSDYSPFVLY